MTATGPALPCPHCQRVLEPNSWHGETAGRCGRCLAEFDFFPFPALTAERVRIAPQAALVAEDSVCFFHGENRAEVVCDDCGRLLCAVCAISFGGRRACPSCVAASKKSEAAPVVRQRVLYDSLALTLALFPLVLWPFTLVTAPVALGIVIAGWNKPNSLVRGPGRTRLIVAGIFALLEIAVWVTVGVFVWLKP